MHFKINFHIFIILNFKITNYRWRESYFHRIQNLFPKCPLTCSSEHRETLNRNHEYEIRRMERNHVDSFVTMDRLLHPAAITFSCTSRSLFLFDSLTKLRRMKNHGNSVFSFIQFSAFMSNAVQAFEMFRLKKAFGCVSLKTGALIFLVQELVWVLIWILLFVLFRTLSFFDHEKSNMSCSCLCGCFSEFN